MPIREKSGTIDSLKNDSIKPISIDYNTYARAKIFRREKYKVKDNETYKDLIRFNDYKNDEFSPNNPSYTIAGRYDLRENNQMSFGATEAKFGSINEIGTKTKKSIIYLDLQQVMDWILLFGVLQLL